MHSKARDHAALPTRTGGRVMHAWLPASLVPQGLAFFLRLASHVLAPLVVSRTEVYVLF
jgi:hypothetical protein